MNFLVWNIKSSSFTSRKDLFAVLQSFMIFHISSPHEVSNIELSSSWLIPIGPFQFSLLFPDKAHPLCFWKFLCITLIRVVIEIHCSWFICLLYFLQVSLTRVMSYLSWYPLTCQCSCIPLTCQCSVSVTEEREQVERRKELL